MSSRIVAENSLRNTLDGAVLQKQYPDLQWIEDYKVLRRESVPNEKQRVIFARKRGAWLKPFHCYHQNSEFSYYSLDVAEGCLFDCVYCYLQSYLEQQSLVIFVGDINLENEIPVGEKLWISTGLLSDSLLAEKYFPRLPALSHSLPATAILDLRTKSDEVSVLEDREICRDNIVVSWSVNPDEIAAQFEYRAPSLARRVCAARKAVELGYRIGWHLDPMFHVPDWKEAYQALFEQLREIDVNRVAFLSIGLFRFMPDLGTTIRRRFVNHPILSGEFFPDADGKYHYLRGIRKEMYRSFQEWLEPWQEKTPIFWSMEPDSSLVAV